VNPADAGAMADGDERAAPSAGQRPVGRWYHEPGEKPPPPCPRGERHRSPLTRPPGSPRRSASANPPCGGGDHDPWRWLVHWSVLGEDAARVLEAVGKTALARRYVLAGGTALALVFGHRLFRDLYFFSWEPATRLDGARILRSLRASGMVARPVNREADQLDVSVDGVSVTFLAYPFRFLYPPLRERGVRIADPRDVALMKALAMGRRATARDYVDLAYLLENGVVDLGEVIEQAKKVFRLRGESQFSERLFLQQLVYTADLEDREEAVALLVDPGWDFNRVEEVLRRHVTAWTRKTLRGTNGGNGGSAP